jgi:hypothetical protein
VPLIRPVLCQILLPPIFPRGPGTPQP